jgi:hypothetical protein
VGDGGVLRGNPPSLPPSLPVCAAVPAPPAVCGCGGERVAPSAGGTALPSSPSGSADTRVRWWVWRWWRAGVSFGPTGGHLLCVPRHGGAVYFFVLSGQHGAPTGRQALKEAGGVQQAGGLGLGPGSLPPPWVRRVVDLALKELEDRVEPRRPLTFTKAAAATGRA